MTRQSNKIDRDKLRAQIRKLGNENVLCMLEDAIDLLPSSKLYKLPKKSDSRRESQGKLHSLHPTRGKQTNCEPGFGVTESKIYAGGGKCSEIRAIVTDSAHSGVGRNLGARGSY
jgi:hypothetical protein